MRLKNDEQPKVLLTKNEEGEFVIDPDFLKLFEEEESILTWKNKLVELYNDSLNT